MDEFNPNEVALIRFWRSLDNPQRNIVVNLLDQIPTAAEAKLIIMFRRISAEQQDAHLALIKTSVDILQGYKR